MARSTSSGQAAQSTSSSSDPNIDIGTPYTPRKPSPIVSISINHPIAQMARKIKNFLTHKQTLFSTTFSIKVTPIVAIVSVLGLLTIFGGGVTTAYQFGKTWEQKFLAANLSPTGTTQPTPTLAPMIVSKSGTVEATYQSPATPTPSGQDEIASSSPTPSATGGLSRNDTPTPQSRPVLHYILVGRSGSITYLVTPTTIRLANYLGVRVLITGTLSNNTLSIAKSEDIEVLQ